MKLLVTGGMGFIGKAVINKLLNSDVEQIFTIDNLLPKIHGEAAEPYDFKDKRVSFIKGDVVNRNELEPLIMHSDVILHLAAETGTGQSMYEIELYNRANITATALLMDILTNKKHSVKRVVVASSRAIYGEGKYLCAKDGIVYPDSRLTAEMTRGDFEVKCPICREPISVMPTSEDSLIHPISFYGITKHVQETMIMTLCKNIGVDSVALRYQNVYGPGQSLRNPYTGILSVFSNLLRLGKDINIFEDGKESRDFIFIDDVADATTKAMFAEDAKGQILNVGFGKPVSVLEVAAILKELLGSKSKIYISGKYRVGDIRHNYADMAKTEKTLKYTPKINFKDGAGVFVKWVKNNKISPNYYDQSIDEMQRLGLYK